MKMKLFKLTLFGLFITLIFFSVVGCGEPGIDPSDPAIEPVPETVIPQASRGQLDTSLGEDGSVGFFTNYTDVYDIIVDSNNKIRLTGEYSESSSSRRIYTWAFNEDGTMEDSVSHSDPFVFLNSYAITETDAGIIRTCGTKGYDMQRFDIRKDSIQAYAAYSAKSAGYAITAKGGRTLIAGIAGNDWAVPNSMQVWCYEDDFSTDLTFGVNGVINFANDGIYEKSEGWDIEIDKDGKILVAGNCTADSIQYIALWKYNSDGTPDNSFGNNGLVLENQGGGIATKAGGKAVAVAADGRIFVAGHIDGSMTLLCYKNDGSLDTSFAQNGAAVSSHEGYRTRGHDIALTSDGDIIVSGLRERSNTDAFIKIWCYNSDGSPDTGFGEDGIVDGSGIMYINADFWSVPVALDKNGRIIVSATCRNPDNPEWTKPYFWRYLN